MRKYLISGIGISASGVGRLMKNLSPQAEKHGYTVIARRQSISIRELAKQKKILGIFIEMLLRFSGRLYFEVRVFLIRNSHVIFLHPQTAGFGHLIRLVKNNSLYWYVMDNSFFCIKSYNLHPKFETECLKCVGAPEAVFPKCQPFPIAFNKTHNEKWLKKLQDISSRIVFLAQNERQRDLLKLHFGVDSKIEVVGLDTAELVSASADKNEGVSENSRYDWDLVFHGAPHLAKGLRYFIELAEALPMYSAFVPSEKAECEKTLGRKIQVSNIIFTACSWETGLMAAVQSSRVVVNPSLWSAPIEGALLKSIHYGNIVATVESQYGYEGEIASSSKILRLPREIDKAAEIICSVIGGRHSEFNNTKRISIKPQNINYIFDVVSAE